MMDVQVGKKYQHFKGHIVEVIAIGTIQKQWRKWLYIDI